jgi:uncharacterized iron-regulated protein
MMRFARSLLLLVLAALPVNACARAGAQPPAASPDADPIVDVRTGKALTREQLLDRLAAADYVLLGEVHDNPAHHRLRGELIVAGAGRRPALVFEHFPWRADSMLQHVPASPSDAWLAQAGFDAKGWRWPVHAPLLEAAAKADLPGYGSQLDRETLRPMRQGGAAAAPAPLGDLMARVPLEGEGLQALDRTLLEGHCGQLPEQMVPLLRLSQEARDAAMTEAMMRAGERRPAWLLAGNGHVRKDYGVPRFLARLAPAKRTVSVGFLEREEAGAPPPAAEQAVYDVVWFTDRAEREDPCKDFGR